MSSAPNDDFASNHEDGQQRGETRDSLLLTGGFRVLPDSDVAQVRIRNLSAGGLMVEYPTAIAVGDRVEVEVRNIGWVRGHIAWCTEGRAGVAFDSPIDPLRARKPVGQGQHTPVYAKAIVTRR